MSSLVERLRGCSDDEIVRALQKQMLLGANAEATEFLRSLPPERADAIRWKLVDALESIGKKKAQKNRPIAKPAPVSAAASAPPPPAAAPNQKVKRGRKERKFFFFFFFFFFEQKQRHPRLKVVRLAKAPDLELCLRVLLPPLLPVLWAAKKRRKRANSNEEPLLEDDISWENCWEKEDLHACTRHSTSRLDSSSRSR